MNMLPNKIELRLVIGSTRSWKPYFAKYKSFRGFECSVFNIYFQAVFP